jgi:hypothetical protein
MEELFKMSEPNYKEKYSEMISDNLKNFNVNDDGVKKKIEKFCSKFGFDRDEVTKKINEEEFLRAFFIKEPAKQNLYEKIFGDFLKEMKGITICEKLPASGPDSIFIINQEVRVRRKSDNSITKQAKSMDFHFKYDGIDADFYVFHKYTKEAGGAQDNQKNDVINAIDKASAVHISDKIYVLFVCDGEYYNSKNWKDVDVHVRDDNFKLLKSGQIEEYLINIKNNQ